MSGIKHVLIATDGSAGALKAAEFGGELARTCGAAVSVIFVRNDDAIVHEAWGPSSGMSVDQVREKLQRQAEEAELPKTAGAVGDVDGDVRSVLVWGHPATEICQFAEAQDVDLIVIGSHGRSGLKEALLGSVSHTVANRAPCPVTIVR
jgi:nucleotide-binding universal stress UspA family protein